MYSAINPSDLAAYLKEADRVAFRSHARVASRNNIKWARILASRLLSYDEEIEEPGGSASWLAAQFLLARNLGSITRSVSRIRFEQGELSKTFRSAPDVISLLFLRRYGVDLNTLQSCMQKYPRVFSAPASVSISSGHSFLKRGKKIAQNSTGLGGFKLTDDQWAKIRRLFPDTTDPISRRGRPAWSARQILDALFWKVAQGTDWYSLPAGSPSPPTCRRFMKSCTNDGRILLTYLFLYQDLLDRTQMQGDEGMLEQLLEYFYISPGLLIQIKTGLAISNSGLEIWQLNTARLFLQFAYELIRRFRLEEHNPYFPLDISPIQP